MPTFIGTNAGETLVGGSDDDTLIGLGGADALAGGAGADTFVYQSFSDTNASGYDNLYDFQTGVDHIDLTALTTTAVSIFRSSDSSYVYADTPDGQLQIIAAGRPVNGSDVSYSGDFGVFIRVLDGYADLVGSSHNDTLFGGGIYGAQPGVITGGLGADYLAGGSSYVYLTDQDSTPDAYDVIANYDAVATLNLSALNVSNIGIVSVGAGQFLFGTTASGATFQLATTQVDLRTNSFNGDTIITGNQQGFTYVGNGASILYGGHYSDHMYGTDAGTAVNSRGESYIPTEVFRGGGGGDLIVTGGGDNYIEYNFASDSSISDPDTIFGFVSGRDQLSFGNQRTGFNASFGIAYDGAGNSFVFVDIGRDGSNDMLIQVAGATVVLSDITNGSTQYAPTLENKAVSTGFAVGSAGHALHLIGLGQEPGLDGWVHSGAAHHDAWLI